MLSNTKKLNTTEILLDGLEAEEEKFSYTIPQGILFSYYFFSALGAIANVYLILLTIRFLYRKYTTCHKIDDIFLVLFFLAFCDVGTLVLVSPFEISVLSYGCESSGMWVRSSGVCRIFLGMEMLFNTETAYLLVIFTFTVINRMRKENSRKPEIILIPIALSWTLSWSLSIPLFVQGETVSPKVGLTLCTVVNRWTPAALLILFFKFIIPSLLLLTGAIFICVKWFDTKEANCTYPRLLLVLAASYCLLSLYRSVFTLLYVLIPGKGHKGPDDFKVPPLANVANSHSATLIFSMLHYSVSALRPVEILFCLKGFKWWKKSMLDGRVHGTYRIENNKILELMNVVHVF